MNKGPFTKKMQHEVHDHKWTTLFFDFFTLLDDETRSKYPVYGLGMADKSSGYKNANIEINGKRHNLFSESTVYRAMAAICDEEGDYYLALACLMAVKSCSIDGTASHQLKRIRDKRIDEQIEEVKQKLPDSRRDILKEWKEYV